MGEIEVNEVKAEKPQPKKKKKNGLILGLVVLIVILAGALAFMYLKYQKAEKKTPEVVAKEETDFLVERVGKLSELPKDETPQVATVLDKEKLKDQAFFNNAQNGDKILIYTKAQKAIVYRVKENKIINIGPISLNQGNQVGIAVVGAGGNTADAQKKVADKYGAVVNVTVAGDAKNKTAIKKTTVVDTTGRFGKEAQEIADMLAGTVGQASNGETLPEGAALVVFVK